MSQTVSTSQLRRILSLRLS